MFSGVRYGRGRSGSEIRRRITASWAAVNARSTPNENTLARKVTECAMKVVRITIPLVSRATAMIACGETSVRRCRRPKTRGSWPCSPSE
jgi:hypothetical protein